MSIPVETLSYVGVMAVMLGVMWKLYDKITTKHDSDIEKVTGQCNKIQRRLAVLQAKQDIYLHELGLDVPKVNSEIANRIVGLDMDDPNGEYIDIRNMDIEELKRRKPE